MTKKVVDAKEARDDILAGLSDAELMEKYRVSAKGLESLFSKLLKAGIISQSQLDERMHGYDATVHVTARVGPFIIVPTPEEIEAAQERLREKEEAREKERDEGARRVGVSEAVADIRAGMGDAELMEKYRLTAKGLQSLFEKLLDRGWIDRGEYEERMVLIEGTVDLHEVIGELAIARPQPAPDEPGITEGAHGATEAYREFIEKPGPKPEESTVPPPDRPGSDEIPGPPWYDNTGLVVVLLVFVFPVGFYALIKNTKLKIGIKAAIAVAWGILGLGIAGVLLFPETSKVGEVTAASLNTRFKGVCRARMEGAITQTLLIDWTIRTKKRQAEEILDEVRALRKSLYEGGVRYVKFPNASGTYNRLDLRTGEATVTDERAIPYVE